MGFKTIRFYVCGIGYDKDNCVTDYEYDFGDFDSYEEAYERFVKVQCDGAKEFFEEHPKAHQVLVQLEKCKETPTDICCLDVQNEWWMTNPNVKEN